MEYTVGQVVYSKSGHDKGQVFFILSVVGEYILLVDGKTRTLEKPKRKKKMHVQPTNFVNDKMATALMEREEVLDAHIVKALKEYKAKEGK